MECENSHDALSQGGPVGIVPSTQPQVEPRWDPALTTPDRRFPDAHLLPPNTARWAGGALRAAGFPGVLGIRVGFSSAQDSQARRWPQHSARHSRGQERRWPLSALTQFNPVEGQAAVPQAQRPVLHRWCHFGPCSVPELGACGGSEPRLPPHGFPRWNPRNLCVSAPRRALRR